VSRRPGDREGGIDPEEVESIKRSAQAPPISLEKPSAYVTAVRRLLSVMCWS